MPTSTFEAIIMACIIIIAICLLVALGALILSKDELTRAVLSDMVFYSMVAIFLVWTLITETMIGYDIAVLAALACGVVPTISMARIISRGRR
ncbi:MULTISPECIES: cation:proton antiporter [Corynebacterium]|uniref:cation:proton antiporter n=1 Tax=Corynebacterium TaxID=1716 RepID=UPI0008A31EC6|nr:MULTISPECIES: cation:proton antiporter [Corynebacterium]MDK7180849.1 cation:proton antiporter [Corynebacterium riegelii]OFT80802.1 cation:proton antiporter [Corynebacterium sp. HMSC29G08]